MASNFAGKVGEGVAAVLEWQRGAINWAECLRRVNVTGKGEHCLASLTRTSSEDDVARAVTAANGSGN